MPTHNTGPEDWAKPDAAWHPLLLDWWIWLISYKPKDEDR